MADYNRNWRNRNRENYPEWEEFSDQNNEFRSGQNRGNMIYGQDYGYQNRSEYDDKGRVYEERYQRGRDRDDDYSYSGRYRRDSDFGDQGFENRGRRSNYLNDDRSNYAYGGYGRSGLGGVYDDERYEPTRYGNRSRSGGRNYGYNPNDRDWWDRTSDEISSWFGDEDAERRREMDKRYGKFRGKGPKGYNRSDERILEDINDRLADDPFLDASDIEVTVNNREVILSGSVDSKMNKRRAEDIVDAVSGVTHLENRIRVNQVVSGERYSSRETTTEKNKNNKYNEIQI